MVRLLKRKLNSQDLIIMGLYTMALFPLFPNKLKGVPVVLLLITALFFYKKKKYPSFGKSLIFGNSIIYLLYMISVLYSSNIPYATRKLETGLSLIIFPIIFGLIWEIRKRIDKKLLLRKFALFFFGTTFIYVTIVFVYLSTKGIFKYYKDPNFIRHFTQSIPYIGQHPIYASIFFSIALLFSMYLMFQTKNNSHKLIILFGEIIIFLLLLSLASKGIILAFLIAIGTFAIMSIKSFKKRMYVLTPIIGLMILGAIFLPSLSERLSRFGTSLNLSSTIEEGGSTEIRKAVFLCSIKSIKGNWLFGHGIGDVEDSLTTCYNEVSPMLIEGHYNTHNQYLSILLSNGIVGLLGVFLFLFLNFKTAISSKNYLYISILLFYSITMLIENILARQSGVILFAFLVNFLGFLTYKGKERLEIELRVK